MTLLFNGFRGKEITVSLVNHTTLTGIVDPDGVGDEHVTLIDKYGAKRYVMYAQIAFFNEGPVQPKKRRTNNEALV